MSSVATRALCAAPFALFVYPFAGLLLSRSQVPLVLGRWSLALGTVLGACTIVYALAATALVARRVRPLELTLLLLVLLTYAVPGSNAGQRLPSIQYVLPVVRLLAAAAWVVLELEVWRERREAGVYIALASIVGLLALADIGIGFATDARPRHARASHDAFRQRYALEELSGDAVVIVGDSFVWGQGVAAEQTFGARLEARRRAAGTPGRVYSLGVIGAGTPEYERILRSLPAGAAARRVIISFYANDMPGVERYGARLRQQLIALGVGAPTLRVVGDVLARSAVPTMAKYHQLVVDDYDPQGPGFARRWAVLRGALERIHAQAAARSVEPPAMLLLPLMVSYRPYPLQHGHDRLSALAEGIGYEVIDMLPLFRERLGDGDGYRVAPDDNHFDAEVHDLVAAALAVRLADTGTSSPETAPLAAR